MVSAMHQPLALILATVLAAGFATAADSQTRPAPRKPASTAMPPPPPPPDPRDQIKTSDQVKRESVQGAATAPLRDLNMVKTQIPEILIEALEDPYARPPRNWKCPALIVLIRPLDAALGPDLDQVPPGDEDLMDRGKQTAFGVAGDLASGAIPFRGVVRRLSGANTHDRLVQSAIVAGNVRRAYLKGLGEARGCGPPATPSHERAALSTTGAEDKVRATPKYPTRTAAPQKRAGTSPYGPAKSRP